MAYPCAVVGEQYVAGLQVSVERLPPVQMLDGQTYLCEPVEHLLACKWLLIRIALVYKSIEVA